MIKKLLFIALLFPSLTFASFRGAALPNETITPICDEPYEYLVIDNALTVLDGGLCAGNNEPDGGNSIVLSDPPYTVGETYILQVWEDGSYTNLLSQSTFKVLSYGILNANTRSITSSGLASSLVSTMEVLWPILLVGLGLSLAFVIADRISDLILDRQEKKREEDLEKEAHYAETVRGMTEPLTDKEKKKYEGKSPWMIK